MSKEERIATFRRDCIESMVGNTCDNIHDTGNSLTGVSIRESAAYYLVRATSRTLPKSCPTCPR